MVVLFSISSPRAFVKRRDSNTVCYIVRNNACLGTVTPYLIKENLLFCYKRGILLTRFSAGVSRENPQKRSNKIR